MPVDPPGYDSDNIMFHPIPAATLVTLRVEISDTAARYIESAVATGHFSERQIVEGGALMFLAHITGQINILGPDGVQFVRRMANALEEGFDADAMLATIVNLAETSELAESAIGMFKDAFPPAGD